MRVAVCMSDAPDWPMWDRVTTDLVYIRLHGHTRKYASSYSKSALKKWATRTRVGYKKTATCTSTLTTMPKALHRRMRSRCWKCCAKKCRWIKRTGRCVTQPSWLFRLAGFPAFA